MCRGLLSPPYWLTLPHMYASIALLSPPYATLSYALPPEFPQEFWQPGLRVAVPLGRGDKAALRAGVLLETSTHIDLPAGVACKSVCWPLEEKAVLTPELLALAQDLALRQALSPGHILGHVLPQGLRLTRVRLRLLHEKGAASWPLARIRGADVATRQHLAQALAHGQARLLPPGADAASEEFCVLRVDPPWPVRPSATRQIEILEFLHEHGAVSRRHLIRSLGQGAGVPLQSLLAAGHVTLTRQDAEDVVEAVEQSLLPPPPASFTLNDDQERALADMKAALENAHSGGRAASRLLYGVTGSGKTAVYLELARACLESGRSMLLLAPEVALAHKLRRDAACALPQVPLFFHHGYQSPARREDTYRQLAGRDEPCLVVGTRSALFLPVPHLGCIVLDEEHDASFKQDESLAYQAKEVAWFRMAQIHGLLVLGSATPDLKTFHASESGHLPILRLPRRVGDRDLPPVELVDISSLSPAATSETGLLAPRSEEALREVISRGEQAVVLLNRRGYAPLMYCLDCGRTLRCPHCEIGLTYHKGREKLVCHYCGYTRPFPSPCPECKGMNFLPMGEGTERLGERLEVLAGAPVLRLDRDSTRRPGRMEEILAAFARQESSILVGTQMLSKGHHFPNVTLAVVADGDLGLNLPDYRAAERTFQLLVQSSGRAGRGDKAGQVLIQTRDVSHYCWQYVREADYEGFYAAELARRRLRRYPPFVRLALIRISHGIEESGGPAALNDLAVALRGRSTELGLQLLGPAPAPLALLRGRRRYTCLVKGQDWQAIRSLYFFALSQKCAKNLRLFLDLDPVNML